MLLSIINLLDLFGSDSPTMIRPFRTYSLLLGTISCFLGDGKNRNHGHIFVRAQTPEVVLGETGSNACPGGDNGENDYEPIQDARMCVAAMDLLGPGNSDLDPNAFPAELYVGTEDTEEFPSGCYTFDYEDYQGLVSFNNHPTGTAGFGTPICIRKSAQPPEFGGILYIGDSDVDYWVSPPGPSYNVGVGGATCKDVLETVDPMLEYFRPSIVVLVCGENDLLSFDSVKTISGRRSDIVARANAKNASVVFLGTKDEPSTSRYHTKYGLYDDESREAAKRACDIEKYVSGRPAFTFLDGNAAFKDIGNPETLYAPDQLHLSSEGYTLWSEWVATTLADETCCVWKGHECLHNNTSAFPNAGEGSAGSLIAHGTNAAVALAFGWLLAEALF